MTPARFAELAAAYGGDIARWPASERASARDLLHADAEAAVILGREAELDAALLTWSLPGPGSAIMARITARVTGRIMGRVARHRDRVRRLRLWLSGLVGAAAFGGGVAAGFGLVSTPAHLPEQDLSHLYELRVLGAPLVLDGASDQAPL